MNIGANALRILLLEAGVTVTTDAGGGERVDAVTTWLLQYGLHLTGGTGGPDRRDR